MTRLTKDEIDTDFLAAELDTGYSMLRIAQGRARTRPDCQAVLVIARAALGTIRRLEGGIQDARVWRDIHAGANELKSALAAVCVDCPLRAGCNAEQEKANTRSIRSGACAVSR